MQRINKKIYLLLTVVLIIFVLFFIFAGLISKPEKPLVENDELKLLKQFFPDKLIVHKDDKDYYIIDGKDYYVKSMGDVNRDGFTEFVSMEIVNDQGKIYRFYAKIENEYSLIGEGESLIWHIEDERNKEMEFMLQDITGDGIDEIIVPYEQNGSNNRWYQILVFDNNSKKLVKMVEKNYLHQDQNNIIGFDEIYRENNFTVITWHGTFSRGKSYHSIEGNILNFEKGVQAETNDYNTESYQYQEIDKQGNIVYEETRQGSVWTDSLSR